MSEGAALAFEHVVAGYGETVVLDDVSLTVPRGGTVAILGRNGVGKSTLLATAMGHTTLHGGAVRLDGRDLTRLPAYARNRAGLGYVPQEREIFPSLSVDENLTVAARPGPWTAERIFDLFPALSQRRKNYGNQLSGGEQQMLAVGRALMGNPSTLLMDEPLEGLAPVIVDALLAAFRRLRSEDKLAIVLVEQHARLALEFAEWTAILDRGKIVYSGDSAALIADSARLADLIGVAG
jgi:branched-chain amino acid transport system ATP-binding protein